MAMKSAKCLSASSSFALILLLACGCVLSTANGGDVCRIFRRPSRCVVPQRAPCFVDANAFSSTDPREVFEQAGVAGAPIFNLGPVTRIADPKLSGADVEVSFQLLPAGASGNAIVEVLSGSSVVFEIWNGMLQGGAAPIMLSWNGKDAAGKYVDTGNYKVRVRGSGPIPAPVEAPLSIVRLGITEIAAKSSASVTNEWQMVYFKKGTSYAFYPTPDFGEYHSKANTGEISDLDLDDGNPRPISQVHTATDSPALEGSNYEDDAYNYPLCYLKGAQPRLEVTLGATGTTAGGISMAPGYPVAGLVLRVQSRMGASIVSSSGPIAPGSTFVLSGPVLPDEVTRVDWPIEFVWQYRETGTAQWTDLKGVLTIPLRFYTLIGEPQFRAGAHGMQYAGPWVEVADNLYQWQVKLCKPINTEADCVEIHVKGFFGQNGGIPTPIEGVSYDTNGGGATHYFNSVFSKMKLSRLLNGAANSIYVNCTDNMGATSTMLAMMGVKNVRPMMLGPMDLRSIWGIGLPDYTNHLWPNPTQAHRFQYHEIVTRDDGAHVIDTCLQVDEDSYPNAVPGIPGWNVERAWVGTNGYMNLSSSNAVNVVSIGTLPGFK